MTFDFAHVYLHIYHTHVNRISSLVSGSQSFINDCFFSRLSFLRLASAQLHSHAPHRLKGVQPVITESVLYRRVMEAYAYY